MWRFATRTRGCAPTTSNTTTGRTKPWPPATCAWTTTASISKPPKRTITSAPGTAYFRTFPARSKSNASRTNRCFSPTILCISRRAGWNVLPAICISFKAPGSPSATRNTRSGSSSPPKRAFASTRPSRWLTPTSVYSASRWFGFLTLRRPREAKSGNPACSFRRSARAPARASSSVTPFISRRLPGWIRPSARNT